MMTKKSFLLLSLILLIGCNQSANKNILSFEQEVEELITVEDKQLFLEQILAADQGVRNGTKEAELISRYGYDSKEHFEFTKAQWKQDEINLGKIDAYLKKFGYPKKAVLGKDAAMTPWLVIHHSTDIGVRNSYFGILYQAYLTEDLDDNFMSLYLGRTYNLTFKEMFRMESPYQSKDEINQLIKILGFEEEQTKVEQNRKD